MLGHKHRADAPYCPRLALSASRSSSSNCIGSVASLGPPQRTHQPLAVVVDLDQRAMAVGAVLHPMAALRHARELGWIV
jgi:hypothetical protein